MRNVMIRRVKIANLIGRILEWLITDLPTNIINGLSITQKFNPRRFKKWHRKITRQMHALLVKAHDHRKRFHQKFSIIAIIKRARSKEERDWRFNGRVGEII